MEFRHLFSDLNRSSQGEAAAIKRTGCEWPGAKRSGDSLLTIMKYTIGTRAVAARNLLHFNINDLNKGAV